MAESLPRTTGGWGQHRSSAGTYHLVSPDRPPGEAVRTLRARDAEEALRAWLLPWLKATIPWPPLEDGQVTDRGARGPETVLAVTRDGERWIATEVDGAVRERPHMGDLLGCLDAAERAELEAMWSRLGRQTGVCIR